MRLTSVSLHNFGSHEDTTLDFDALQVVTGPNGAGKSKLFDAIRYGLFGDKAGSADSFVRKGSDQMRVSLTFELNDAVYRIARSRSRKGRGLSMLELQVSEWGPERDTSWQPLTGGSVQETQARLEQILKIDYPTWVNSAMLVQGDPGFTARRPTERKDVLSRILSLDEVYKPLQEAAQERRLTAQTMQQHLALQLSDAEAAAVTLPTVLAVVDNLNEQLTGVRLQLAEAEEKLEQIRSEKAEAQAKVAQLPSIDSRIQSLEQAAVTLQALTLETDVRLGQLRQRLEQKASYAAVLEANAGAKEHLANLQQRHLAHVEATGREHAAALALDDLDRELRRVREAQEKLLDSECPIIETKPNCVFLRDAHRQTSRTGELEKTFNILTTAHRHAQSALAAIGWTRAEEQKAEKAVIEWDWADSYMRRADADEATLNELTAAQQERSRGLDELAKERAELSLQRLSLALADEMLTKLSNRLVHQRSEVSKLQQEERSLQQAVARELARVESLQDHAADRDRLRRLIVEAQDSTFIYGELAKAFSPDGIPALVIDTILQDLSATANEFLARMPASGSVLSVDLRSLRALKTVAGQRETLDIIVRVGEEEFDFEQLSGGQKVRVEFCLRVALGRLLAHRRGARIETLLIDEGDLGELDVPGKEAFLSAIRGIQSDFQVIAVASHLPEVKDADWPRVIQVEQLNGISSVRG